MPLPRFATALVLLACTLSACDKGEADSKDAQKTTEREIPSKPINGGPIAAEFVKFIGEGEGRGLEAHLYNFEDKTAAGYVILARYYDASEKLLPVELTGAAKDNDFTSLSGGRYACKPKGHATIELDGRMLSVPENAARAELVVSKVRALNDDGMTIDDWWEQDDWTKWPATQ